MYSSKVSATDSGTSAHRGSVIAVQRNCAASRTWPDTACSKSRDRSAFSFGQNDFRFNALRNFNGEDDLAAFLFISRKNLAAHALVFRAEFRQSFAGVRGDPDLCKSRSARLYPSDAPINELHHPTVSIMVIAVHAVGR